MIRAVVLLLFSLSAFYNLNAQTGTLKGQVTDSSGASIPGAAVTLAGPAGFHLDLSTDAQGVFTANTLTPGTYNVTVSHFGFAPFKSKPITVRAANVASLPVTMQLQTS